MYSNQKRRAETEAFVGRVREVARSCGYSVAVHGSLARDLDLVAVPWTPEAVSASVLVQRLCEDVPLGERVVEGIPEGPEPKPWGRFAWSLHGCPHHEYVDLSVAPRAGEPVPLIYPAVGAKRDTEVAR
jgi:hypothetical protein